MRIRQIGAGERPEASVPIQAYGFQPSPAPAGTMKRLNDSQRYYEEHLTLVAEVAGVTVADASAVPMQQNVRGGVYRMAGVAGVATLPQARRRGYASALVTEVL
jgi:predicted acetyltransferase